MKVLLAAINAKYIHSNLGIYSLKAYGDQVLKRRQEHKVSCPVIELAEYTINHQMEGILQDIYRRKPDIVGFSCYIWNITWIKALLPDLKQLLPHTRFWLGGPEVSYDAREVLTSCPQAELVMKGEGEGTFAQLLELFVDKEVERPHVCGQSTDQALLSVPGITFRMSDGSLHDTGFRPVMDMNEFPFAYGSMDMKELEHRIIYYESSRGCPFSCSYCLSSIDKKVRFRDIELVKKELSFFLSIQVPQVKFVDRTFNCNKKHAMSIWKFIKEHDTQVTNFHFEIAADLLDEEAMELLASMRPGLIQLEIGVQSTYPKTLEAIRRKTDIDEIRRITSRINSGHNVHQHLDLIAGLPHEDLERFRCSFNQVYSMAPEQLQLGFLKVLKGSYMEEMAESYGLCASVNPPYEVLSTRWLSFDDILELKAVEEMVEVYYNSRQFVNTLKLLEKAYPSPYEMFLAMAAFYRENGHTGLSHSRLARYEILWDMICAYIPATEVLGTEVSDAEASDIEAYRDSLMYDLYLRENVKSRPSFARDITSSKQKIREFFTKEEAAPFYLTDYQGYDSRQMSKMAHIEPMADGSLVLFDYKNRDPLTYNARAVRIEEQI